MKKMLLVVFVCFTTNFFAQDGSLDMGFNVGSGVNYNPYAIIQLNTGKILVAGQFTEYNGMPAGGMARLNEDGSLDNTFNPGGTGLVVEGYGAVVYNAYEEDNGKIIIVGAFNSYNGVPRRGIARLNADGTLDEDFVPVVAGGSSFEVVEMVKQNDKYIFSGSFTYPTSEGPVYENIMRLNNDGSIDTGFPAFAFGGSTGYATVTLRENNKMLITGAFTYINETTASGAVMVNEDGSLDTAFAVGAGQINAVREVIPLPDGKFIFGGTFEEYNGFVQRNIIKINADGTVDETFVTDTPVNISIMTMVKQPDGKIILGGWSNGQQPVTYLQRLNANGTHDATFNMGGQGINNTVNNIFLQNDGKLLVTGWFSGYNDIERNKIARLNATSELSLNDNIISVTGIYPNPTTGILSVNLNVVNAETDAVVYDVLGKIVLQKKLSQQDKSIDLSNYNSGLYFVKLVYGNKTAMHKVIKN